MTAKVDYSQVVDDGSSFSFLVGEIGRLQTMTFTPVVAGDVYSSHLVGVMKLSPLIRGLAMDAKVDICTFYVPHRHSYGDEWIEFMKAGGQATPLSDLPCQDVDWALNYLSTLSNYHNRCPKWLHESYRSIYNNYYRYPCDTESFITPLTMTEKELQYGMQCCHLPSIWTAPVDPDYAVTQEVPLVDGAVDISLLTRAYAALDTDQERDLFMKRYRDVNDSFGGRTYYDADKRPHMLMATEFYASGYDVNGTSRDSLGQFSGRVQQNYEHRVPDFFVPEHGVIMTVALVRFHPVHENEVDFLVTQTRPDYQTISNDPVLVSNEGTREIEIRDVFDGTLDSSQFRIAAGQWYRYKANFVSERYRAVTGYPFLNKIPAAGSGQVYVDPEDYQDMFETTPLAHWNSQCRSQVDIKRRTPTTRDSLMTS